MRVKSIQETQRVYKILDELDKLDDTKILKQVHELSSKTTHFYRGKR